MTQTGSGSSAPWTVLDGEFSKYISLGEPEKFWQRDASFRYYYDECMRGGLYASAIALKPCRKICNG